MTQRACRRARLVSEGRERWTRGGPSPSYLGSALAITAALAVSFRLGRALGHRPSGWPNRPVHQVRGAHAITTAQRPAPGLRHLRPTLPGQGPHGIHRRLLGTDGARTGRRRRLARRRAGEGLHRRRRRLRCAGWCAAGRGLCRSASRADDLSTTALRRTLTHTLLALGRHGLAPCQRRFSAARFQVRFGCHVWIPDAWLLGLRGLAGWLLDGLGLTLRESA